MTVVRLLLAITLMSIAPACGDDGSSSAPDSGPGSGDGDGDGDGDGNGDGDGDGDPDAGDGDGDGDGDPDAGDGDGDGDGDLCGAPEPGAAFVTPEVVGSDAPAPEANGGEIVSGTYDLVSLTYIDPGPSCARPIGVQSTLILDATSASRGTGAEGFVYRWDETDIESFSYAYEYSIEDTVSTWNVVCPEPPTSSEQSYTASGDTLELVVNYREGECHVSIWTYQRR